MKRRPFLEASIALAAPVLRGGALAATPKRPNIVYIFTDQQHAGMMSSAGNPWLKTAAMDYLAAHGARFERAYCANPVCVPSRIATMTGRLPDEFGARENGSGMRAKDIPDEVLRNTIGRAMSRAGYRTAYGGKVHLPGPLTPKQQGFEILTGDQRDGLAAACADFIKGKQDKPFFLMASFINPHDICYMALRDHATEGKFSKDAFQRGAPAQAPGRKTSAAIRRMQEALKKPDGVDEAEFFARRCPPLPPNHEPQKDEPDAIRWLIQERKFRQWARDNYTDREWRLHRWAYCRLTEMVDRQIGRVLDAVRESGQEENTVVILSSDHGDNDGSHKLEHKTALYEESARVPLVVMQKGKTPGGRVDREHVVSNGLDLLPTLCDYAGVEAPAGLRGRSFRSLAEGRPDPKWRQALGVESQIGRMVVTRRHKYIRYDKGEAGREQLLDLEADPGETRSFAGEASHADTLGSLRSHYQDWFPKDSAKASA